MNSINKDPRFPQNGFSLIEIMVALALGAIILLGVAEIFTNNSQTRAEIERTGQQIESGSYAIGLIESDLTNAAFWGEAGEQPADPALPLPEVCVGLDGNAAVAASKLVEAMGYPLQGEGAAGCISPKAGTDFIAVRRVASCAYGSPGCDSVDPNFYLQVNACFNASDSSAPLPGVDLRISEDHSVHDYTQRDCSTSAPEYRVLSRIYYVDDCPPPYDPDRPPPPPCLWRAELNGAGGTAAYVQTSLVDGVESLRLEYGLDTTGDGQVDQHTNTPIGTEWHNVVMVRVSLVVVNLEPSAGFSDTRTYVVGGEAYAVPAAFSTYKRQVYARSVSIRNVAGRREAQ